MAACRSVYAAMRLDYGERFMRQFASKAEASAWINRLYTRVCGVAAAAVIDGYGRAVDERRPHLPSLDDVVTAIRTLHGERTRAAEQIAIAAAPKVSGLGGYVEHLAANAGDQPLAMEYIELMREIVARPAATTAEERAARIDKAVAAHAKVMSTAPPVRHRGEAHECAVCGKHANLTHSLGSKDATWFCAEHWGRA